MSSFGSVPEGSVSGPPPRAGHARAVEQDYDRRTAEWREIYAGATFHDHLIRRRLELTLDLVDGATSGAGGASLDVGCGAGQLVVEMARRGYRAAGCDISAGMVAETRDLLAREGLPGRVEQADVERLAYPDGNGPYLYSYTLNSHSLDSGKNPGMASIFDGPVNNPTPYLFKLTFVARPVNKIMLAEEQTSHKLGESIDVNGTSSIINDGRWVGPGDLVTLRHNKKGDVTYADSHVEPILPRVARDDPNYYDPTR